MNYNPGLLNFFLFSTLLHGCAFLYATSLPERVIRKENHFLNLQLTTQTLGTRKKTATISTNTERKTSAITERVVTSKESSTDDSTAIYAEGELDQAPTLLSGPSPLYPDELVSLGIEGRVELLLLIDKTGSVSESSVIISSHELFTQAALKEIKEFRFLTPKINSNSVYVRIKWVLNFKLPD